MGAGRLQDNRHGHGYRKSKRCLSTSAIRCTSKTKINIETVRGCDQCQSQSLISVSTLASEDMVNIAEEDERKGESENSDEYDNNRERQIVPDPTAIPSLMSYRSGDRL